MSDEPQESTLPLDETEAARAADAAAQAAPANAPESAAAPSPEQPTATAEGPRLPPLWAALLPIVIMVALMVYVFGFIHDAEIYDAAHLPLACSIVVSCIVGIAYGRKFSDMMKGIIERITTSLEAILILFMVGFLISSFMISGTIPALIYYGLDLLSPQTFLPVGCILCALVGMACGSSWTATATVGVAFMTIGTGLGINPALTAGMIISGAYVGDKFSPLSDTTNLAAAVAETDLFDHVRAMASTTGPVFVIALVIYTILGVGVTGAGYDPSVATGIQEAIAETFWINPVLLLPIVVVIVVCAMRVPGLIGITVSVLVGIIFCVVFQTNMLGSDGSMALADIFAILHYGPGIETGNELVDAALSKGGLENQMWTISLIILAVSFGGALERCGAVQRIFGSLKERLNKPGSLVCATLGTSLACDAVMCDQYLGIGIPAPLYVDKYDEQGLGRNMLSRTLEDAGTMWSPLFPWTACGAYQMSVLGLSPFAYFPFAFVNVLSPIFAAITVLLKRNIFWADGAYTNLLGKTKMKKPAAAPEEAHALAVANLERLRAEGKAPVVSQ
ncbi:MAG: Na+/H+ antiporter NhaC [Coriobacteriia bacterium]|nr:Na+/H+ antiporter NhaC [Coriobacteriia bacterium]